MLSTTVGLTLGVLYIKYKYWLDVKGPLCYVQLLG